MSLEFNPTLQRKAQEFEKVASGIVTDFTQKFDQQTLPETIYHYTKRKGLEGILTNGTVWLTDIFELDDPTELRHGVDHAITAMQAEMADAPKEFRWFADIFTRELQAVARHVAHFYVGSFSLTDYDFNQWTTYGNNGKGFCLGFDCARLEQIFPATNKGHASFPVTYDDKELLDLQTKIIRAARPYISFPQGRGGLKKNISSYLQAVAGALTSELIHASIYFKNESFKSQREYRFLQIFAVDGPVPGLKTRENGRIGYREFDWRTGAPDALRGVIVGPASDHDAGTKFANRLVGKFMSKEQKIDVRVSGVPYRIR